jgi:hypothetical protein
MMGRNLQGRMVKAANNAAKTFPEAQFKLKHRLVTQAT